MREQAATAPAEPLDIRDLGILITRFTSCPAVSTVEREAQIQDIVFDDGERIEIADSYPDAETAIAALHELVRD